MSNRIAPKSQARAVTKRIPDPGDALLPRLTNQERAQAELAARRLYEELTNIISLLPEEDRGASSMSRILELDRATCQRLVAATARPDAGVETLVQLPGVQGLRQFLAAMARRPLNVSANEQIAAASAAVDTFESLIREIGGSQRKLRARLAVERAGQAEGVIAAAGASDDVSMREALFRASAAVTGRWSETTISLSIIRPLPVGTSGERMTESIKLRGLIGHRARPDAVPLESFQNANLRVPAADGVSGPTFSALNGRPISGHTPHLLVTEFCSQPLPRVVSHSVGNGVIHVIDVPESPDGSPMSGADIVFAERPSRPDRHPATLQPPVGEVMTLMNFPSRHLVFDVYLHRDIASHCIPSLELHLWTPSVNTHYSSRWSTRFPGGPRLQVLGSGLRGASSNAFSRHAEMTAYLFNEVAWNAEEFVGYRCEVVYPVWRAGYCMSFDFSASVPPSE